MFTFAIKRHLNFFSNIDLFSWIPCRRKKTKPVKTNYRYLSQAQRMRIANENFHRSRETNLSSGGVSTQRHSSYAKTSQAISLSMGIRSSSVKTLKILLTFSSLAKAIFTENDCTNPIYFTAKSIDALPHNIYALKALSQNPTVCEWILHALNEAGCNITRLSNLGLSGIEIDEYCELLPPSPPVPPTQNGANGKSIALLAINGTLAALIKDLICVSNDLKNGCHSEEVTDSVVGYIVLGIAALLALCCLCACLGRSILSCIKIICECILGCLQLLIACIQGIGSCIKETANCIRDTIVDCYDSCFQQIAEWHKLRIAKEIYERFPGTHDPHRDIICQYAGFIPPKEDKKANIVTESNDELVDLENGSRRSLKNNSTNESKYDSLDFELPNDQQSLRVPLLNPSVP